MCKCFPNESNARHSFKEDDAENEFILTQRAI